MRRRKRSHRQSADDKGGRPLPTLQKGETGVVKDISGGYGLVRRLTDMGITPGTEIKVLRKGAFQGPLQIEVRKVELALGWGVASKILVKEKGGENGD